MFHSRLQFVLNLSLEYTARIGLCCLVHVSWHDNIVQSLNISWDSLRIDKKKATGQVGGIHVLAWGREQKVTPLCTLS